MNLLDNVCYEHDNVSDNDDNDCKGLLADDPRCSWCNNKMTAMPLMSPMEESKTLTGCLPCSPMPSRKTPSVKYCPICDNGNYAPKNSLMCCVAKK